MHCPLFMFCLCGLPGASGYASSPHSSITARLSAAIGAKKLSEMALISEKAGKENQISLIRENHEALCKLYETTVQEGYQILDSEICV